MRSVIRLQAGQPYIELIHTHRHATSAAEDALEIFFNHLDISQYGEDPVIPVAKYHGKAHSDSQPSESKVTVEMMHISEAVKFFEEQAKLLAEIGKSREIKVSPEEDNKDVADNRSSTKVIPNRRRLIKANQAKP